jgi:DNA-binding LacI/PurR family transcriptional regulator
MGKERSGSRPTGADVAREAGVSRATVGFVLNATPGQTISEQTRNRVLEAVDRLGYAPSAEARALKRGRSDSVLFYLPRELPLNADFGSLIEHLSTGFAAMGLTLLIHAATNVHAVKVWSAITPVAVLLWHVSEEEAHAMRRAGIRVVQSLSDGPDAIGRWGWGTREESLARLQVNRLVRSGHRRLGYALPHDIRLMKASESRFAALCNACKAYGLPEPITLPTRVDPDQAAETVAKWRAEGVTGVCAHDYVAALSVLAGLRRLGLKAPTDLAVIGIGDSPSAALAVPPLTVVAVDWEATARYFVKVVEAELVGEPVPIGPNIATVIERESV